MIVTIIRNGQESSAPAVEFAEVSIHRAVACGITAKGRLTCWASTYPFGLVLYLYPII
jgi:hypothetical protein